MVFISDIVKMVSSSINQRTRSLLLTCFRSPQLSTRSIVTGCYWPSFFLKTGLLWVLTHYPQFWRYNLTLYNLIRLHHEVDIDRSLNLVTMFLTLLCDTFQCALHHMLSTTVDTRVRGDESSCSQLSQYRALRTARSGRSISDDVEIMKPSDL